jgi:acetyltransferase-like isoleucine patch superfamily enzyme
VSNDITIGPGVIVGLATAVTKNVDAGVSVIGNPMRVLERKLRLV